MRRKKQTEDQAMLPFETKDTTKKQETTSQQLFNHLYEACNILRGPINQDEFKTYVTPILFFKRISDVYDEEQIKAVREYGEDLDAFPEDELHEFVMPAGSHWNDIREKSEDIGKAIIDAMQAIQSANPDTLGNLFSSFDDANWTDKKKLSDERLKDLVEHMSKINVGNDQYSADVMGDAYEFLIKKFADLSKKNAGEFYTPRPVVKLMVKLLKPKEKDTIYDPACGTGGMLIEAIRAKEKAQFSYGKIFGQEKNLATSAIARMNLYLHGAQDFVIAQGDTLRSPVFQENNQLRTFDCVLANPPFSLEKWGASAFESDAFGRNIWGCPTDSCADYAWLQHMVASMNTKTGRLAVVLPQGVLFHSGKEGEMRSKLVESDKLECIITLVSGIFYSTGVSACILFLNNDKPKTHRNKVCMIDGATIYTPQRAQKIMTEENVNEAYGYFERYQDVNEKCAIVSIDAIRDHHYSLSVSQYIQKEASEALNPADVRAEFFAALKEVTEAENNLQNLLKENGIIHD